MINSLTEWKTVSTNSGGDLLVDNFIRTTDSTMAELSMGMVNSFFGRMGKSKEELMQQFEENRGEVFESIYGSMGARSS